MATAPAAVSSAHPPTDMTYFLPLEEQLQAAGMGVSDLSLITRAYTVATNAHVGVERKSGEAYITHPVAVATILADMQMDAETLAAALLHDVPEDTTITLDDIRNQFGEKVARLVDGVTKLKRIEWVSDREDVARAESLRKMFLAMADDVRVVLIKLADRLHNMRTLGSMPPGKQLATAQETMEIYAPLANRLGIWQIKSELEDLAFRTLEPDRYRTIDASLEAQGGNRMAYINRVI